MTKKQLFNLGGSNLDTQTNSANAYEFEALDANGKPCGIYFSVLGAESDAVRKFQARVLKDTQVRQFKAQKTGKENVMTLDEYEQLAIDSAECRTVGWRGVSLDGATELEFNRENVRDIFKRFRLLREQVIEQSDDLGNFIKA